MVPLISNMLVRDDKLFKKVKGQSSPLRCFYYLAPKCLYRGEYKSVLWMEGDKVWLLFYVYLVFFYPFPDFPFYSSKGRPRLHV